MAPRWNPQEAFYTEGNDSSSFGAVPVFIGTFIVTCVAMLVAVPFGLYSAIYLCEYASHQVRKKIKPVLEILAGIPTVVYGYFAAIFLAPRINELGQKLGINISTESALVAGLTMGIMIIPFVLSLSDDVINSVPSFSEGCGVSIR